MPIAVLSVDSVNSQIHDFKDLTSMFDIVFVSNDPKAQSLYYELVKMNIVIEKIIVTDLLAPPKQNETVQDIRERFQSVVDKCSGGIATIVISHHSVINTWKNGFISSEWMVI